jgi:L-lactate dehydrogenase complex protein LldF
MGRIDFLNKIKENPIDKEALLAINKTNEEIKKRVNLAKTYFENYELATQRAAYIKNKSLENSDKLLSTFEFDLKSTKIKVIWATNAENVLTEINVISKQLKLPICFDSSDIIKEIGLNSTTNQSLFYLSTNIYESKILVREAQFIISDASTIVTMNDVPAMEQLQQNCKTQIFIAGIDKVVQTYQDIDLLISLYATNKTGEPTPSKIEFYSGNKFNDDDSCADDIYIVLLDNGRSDIMADAEQRPILNCIRCEACSRASDVVKYIGEAPYQNTYIGPYGALVNYHFFANESYKHLAFASPLCGSFNDVCPMQININRLLEHSRNNAVTSKYISKKENLTIFLWKNAVIKRSNMDKGGAKVKGFMLKQIIGKAWGNKRELPTVAPKSFNQLWRERKDFG